MFNKIRKHSICEFDKTSFPTFLLHSIMSVPVLIKNEKNEFAIAQLHINNHWYGFTLGNDIVSHSLGSADEFCYWKYLVERTK